MAANMQNTCQRRHALSAPLDDEAQLLRAPPALRAADALADVVDREERAEPLLQLVDVQHFGAFAIRAVPIQPVTAAQIGQKLGLWIESRHAGTVPPNYCSDIQSATAGYRYISKGKNCKESAVSQTAAWLVLVVAGLFEIGWAVGLKYTEGFTRLWPSVWTAVALIASMALLGVAVKSLPIGTAYAVWVGIGAVGTAVLGIALLGEPATVARLASIGLVVAGIVGLKLATPT
jgi:quaternary ammonium compound-resistance protein SugE